MHLEFFQNLITNYNFIYLFVCFGVFPNFIQRYFFYGMLIGYFYQI